MPYSFAQCQLFRVKDAKGESVPPDYIEHCKGVTKPKNYKPKSKKSK